MKLSVGLAVLAVLFLTGEIEWYSAGLPPAEQPDVVVTMKMPEPSTTPATPSPTLTEVPEPQIVAASAPLQVSVPELTYSSAVGEVTVAGMGGVINPPITGYPWPLFWVSDRGVAPGSDTQDTTYLACHTSSKKTDEQVPCNMLSRNDQVKPGYTMTVETANGTLVYRVTSARRILRDDFAKDQEVWEVKPNRLVMVMCYITNGRTDYNYVVFADLESFKSN